MRSFFISLSFLILACSLSALFVVGCAEEDAGGVKGSPSDVKTEPGVYDGYEIVDECPLKYPYAVRGTGSRWYDDVLPGDPGRTDALRELGNSALKPAAADIESIGGIGIGTSCRADGTASVNVIMSDWREVDALFVIAGRVLAESDLREEISILVTALEPD